MEYFDKPQKAIQARKPEQHPALSARTVLTAQRPREEVRGLVGRHGRRQVVGGGLGLLIVPGQQVLGYLLLRGQECRAVSNHPPPASEVSYDILHKHHGGVMT